MGDRTASPTSAEKLAAAERHYDILMRAGNLHAASDVLADILVMRDAMAADGLDERRGIAQFNDDQRARASAVAPPFDDRRASAVERREPAWSEYAQSFRSAVATQQASHGNSTNTTPAAAQWLATRYAHRR